MEFGHNLGRSVRDNPIPVALIGIGLGWLVVANSRKAEPPTAWRDEPRAGGNGNVAGRYTGSRVQHSAYAGSNHGSVAAHQSMPYQAAAYEDLATKAMEAGSRVERRAGETEDAFNERAGAAKAAVLGVARDAGETASAFGERVEAALASAADRFKRMTEQAGAMATDAGQAAADMAGDLAEPRPGRPERPLRLWRGRRRQRARWCRLCRGADPGHGLADRDLPSRPAAAAGGVGHCARRRPRPTAAGQPLRARGRCRHAPRLARSGR